MLKFFKLCLLFINQNLYFILQKSMLDLIKDEGKYNRLQSLIAVRKFNINNRIVYFIYTLTKVKSQPVFFSKLLFLRIKEVEPEMLF